MILALLCNRIICTLLFVNFTKVCQKINSALVNKFRNMPNIVKGTYSKRK